MPESTSTTVDAVSPSGKWIAYTSDETGEAEVWVQPFPGGGSRSRISQNGGRFPVWVSDTLMAFVSDDAAMLADLAVTGDRQMRATGYRELASNVYIDSGVRPLDARPDGQAVMVVGATSTSNLLVETNRVAQLGR